MKLFNSLLSLPQKYTIRKYKCTSKLNSTNYYICKRGNQVPEEAARIMRSVDSEECIFSVLTNSWPSCAPVVCVFQSHEALYQSSHFLFHR